MQRAARKIRCCIFRFLGLSSLRAFFVKQCLALICIRTHKNTCVHWYDFTYIQAFMYVFHCIYIYTHMYNLMNFCMYAHVTTTHIKIFPSPPGSSFIPFLVQSKQHSHPQPPRIHIYTLRGHQLFDFYHHRLVFSVLKLHKSGITWHAFFGVWLLSLNMFLRFSHVLFPLVFVCFSFS